MDKRWIIIIVLSLSTLILGYIAFKPAEIINDDKLINRLEDSLKRRTIALELQNKSLELTNDTLTKRNDSLGSLKPKIKIRYDTIYKKIDAANIIQLSNKYDSLFRSNGIK